MLAKEINLLLNSNIIKDYPKLQKFINETPRLDDKNLDILDEETIQFFKNIFPKIKKEAAKEWTMDKNSIEYVPDKDMKCELCGQPIKNICVIKNNITKKSMKIGTECVKHFEINNDFNIETILEENKRIKRLEYLNSIFPGIERDIMEWELYIEEQEILVSKDIKNRYLEEGIKAKQILERYLDKKMPDESRSRLIKEMKQVYQNKEIEMKKIKDYVNKNKFNRLIPSRTLVNRIKSSMVTNKWDIIDMLEEDGIIRHRTLFRIRDEEFSKSLIGSFNKKLKEFDCAIDQVVSNNGLGYQITYRKKNRIKLFCTHEDLCMHYYNLITDDDGDDIDLRGLVGISKIYGVSSVESALYELFELVKGTEFVFRDDIFHEYDDFYVYNRLDESYYELNLNRTIEEFKLDIFIKNKITREKFYTYLLNSCKRPISKEDMDYIRETRDEANEKIGQGI